LAHHVSGCALKLRVVIAHESVHLAVEQIPARSAQAFLKNSAGHARVRAGEKPCRVELNHFHVA
jgi:hypothetical protein